MARVLVIDGTQAPVLSFDNQSLLTSLFTGAELQAIQIFGVAQESEVLWISRSVTST